MDFLHDLFIEDGSSLNIYMMSFRAIVVFFAALFFIRIAKKRFLGRNSAFDIVLSIIVGSLFARTINGSSPLLHTLVAGFIIIALHLGITGLIARVPKLGGFFEGRPKELLKNGKYDKKALIEHHLTKDDIIEALRLEANIDDIERVEICYLENNGKISFVIKNK
jgi:uncharacterized membrane protein YcaP (DUF421 family)